MNSQKNIYQKTTQKTVSTKRNKKLARITAREAIMILEKLGFSFSRQSGSHKIYKNVLGKRVTIPFHGNKILHPKIVKSIIADAEINKEKFNELLK